MLAGTALDQICANTEEAANEPIRGMEHRTMPYVPPLSLDAQATRDLKGSVFEPTTPPASCLLHRYLSHRTVVSNRRLQTDEL